MDVDVLNPGGYFPSKSSDHGDHGFGTETYGFSDESGSSMTLETSNGEK